MRFLSLLSYLFAGFTTQSFARVAQVLPSGDLARPMNNVVYTRLVAQPEAFYEKPLFIGICVFVALIVGLVVGLTIAQKRKK